MQVGFAPPATKTCRWGPRRAPLRMTGHLLLPPIIGVGHKQTADLAVRVLVWVGFLLVFAARLKSCPDKNQQCAKCVPSRDFAPSLRDCDSYIDAHPGLRCACPGLLSILPPGEERRRVHLLVGKWCRWTFPWAGEACVPSHG
jgi:hypothetical protein